MPTFLQCNNHSLNLAAEKKKKPAVTTTLIIYNNLANYYGSHSYDILGARMLWKPKEARILTNFIDQPV
jgi:hypothetical protein